ncbi:MAG: hypothetical protein CAPSK01_000553 [Candidatus Accumulibacter vicinus]|uniref:DUF2569 domain-containing protein n=1 Tax=Candidatus Accumulibacter vicinus TaxID=2954382 RepID=A0A084Y4S5_9PROT|nr:MAG: hypothetical protein CAPSK01_000553 [Candidatus Accumulibacter vicinus]
MINIVASLGQASDVPTRYQGIFIISLLCDIGLTAFLIYAAVLFFGKRRDAPGTIIAFMIVGIVAQGALFLVTTGADAGPVASVLGIVLAKQVLGALIWVPYFLVSKRVKRTFVMP